MARASGQSAAPSSQGHEEAAVAEATEWDVFVHSKNLLVGMSPTIENTPLKQIGNYAPRPCLSTT
jgi:hypothetical protein